MCIYIYICNKGMILEVIINRCSIQVPMIVH